MKRNTPKPAVNRRAISILPWLLLALMALLGGIAIIFLLLNQGGPDREPVENLYGDLVYIFSAIIGGAVGALIAARRSRNPIGWILLGVALIQVVEDVFSGYSGYGLVTQPGALPGAIFAAWFAQWMWTPPFAALLFGILLYPTGELLSRRWRIVAWVGLLGVAALLLSAALASELFVGSGEPPLAFPNPFGLIDAKSIVEPILNPLAFGLVLVSLFAALVSLIIRFRRARADERQQLKWFTYTVAIAIVTLPLAGAVLGTWAQVVQNLAFLLVPIAVGVAILKYRLYDIDLLINRTLVYIPLTALLAGIFSASITITQKIFVALTGATSDAATVLTTLIVVATFEPLKAALQNFVDKRFKEAPDPTRKLKTLGDQMRAVLQVMDVEQMTRRVLDEAVAAFGAHGGAIYLDANGSDKLIRTIGEWNGDAQLSVPLQNNGARLGMLTLAARRNGAEYTAQDRETLQQIADLTAQAIVLDERAKGMTR